MISYEIALGIAIIGVILVYGTLDLQELVRGQGRYLAGGWIPFWGIVAQPVAFFVFLTAALAETKRAPFDLPEGESEIIGYFVEYSGMKFGMFFLADFLETILVACLTTTLFFGGWQVPYLHPRRFPLPLGRDDCRLPVDLRPARASRAFRSRSWSSAGSSCRFGGRSPVSATISSCGSDGWGSFPIAVVNVFVTAVILTFF